MRDLDETQEQQRLEAVVPHDMAGDRIDQVMARLFPDFSRSRITDWIKQGRATVDGKLWKPKTRVVGGELLALSAIIELHTEAVPQEIPLDVVYEDDHLIVINKPAGLVVHPAAGDTGKVWGLALWAAGDLRCELEGVTPYLALRPDDWFCPPEGSSR